jgi:hypothetical protein
MANQAGGICVLAHCCFVFAHSGDRERVAVTMESVLPPPREAMWWLTWRCLGLVYLSAFSSIIPQALPLRGRRGIAPTALVLRRIAQDMGPVRRACYFPTLFWLSSSDTALLLVPLMGIAGALTILLTGPCLTATVVCFAAYLSWVNSSVESVPYPWQMLMCESGFLSIFAAASLQTVPSSVTPPPCIEWLFRFLLFRVMFGFGKKKFGPGWTQHPLYIR